MLVLLPTATNKLLAQWQDPYQVVKHLGKVSYLVDMHDKRKREQLQQVLDEFADVKPGRTALMERRIDIDYLHTGYHMPIVRQSRVS